MRHSLLPCLGDIAAGVRQALGVGPTGERSSEGSSRALMPLVVLLGAFPLGFVLLRRDARERLRFQAPRGVAQPG
jgi:hypothetical protein